MKKLTKNIFCGAALTIGLAPGIALAQSDSGSMSSMKSTQKTPDSMFATKAAHGGAAEVAMGKLAAEKASNPDVKAFGQQMADDHSKANDQLMSVAKDKSMTLPSDMNAKQKVMYTKLSALSGESFDKAYVNGMVKDHEEDVAEFQKEANSGQDSQIKSFASQTLPVIQAHLDKIKAIQSKMTAGKAGM